MRILQVVASYLPAVRYGGTIVSVHGLARALAARGHDVHVYTTNVDGATDSDVPLGTPVVLDGVNVWYFASRRLRRIYRAPDLGAALRRHAHEFDVVHTHGVFLWPLWAAARAARRAGVPYVVSPRGMLERDLIAARNPFLKGLWIAAIERRNLEGAAALHVTSAREADEARAFGFALPPIVEVPNGVDPAPVPPPDMSTSLTHTAGPGPFLLFLGRIDWKKGLDRLIAALPYAEGVRVVMAGNDESGYRRRLEQQAAHLGVAARVVFTGPVYGDDKHALLARARALVLPSYSENFGNVVLEAWAASCPVLVTREVGLAPVVDASSAGIVTGGDAASLSASLLRMWTRDEEVNEMRRRCRAAVASYTWDAVAATMESLYRDAKS